MNFLKNGDQKGILIKSLILISIDCGYLGLRGVPWLLCAGDRCGCDDSHDPDDCNLWRNGGVEMFMNVKLLLFK